HRLFAVLGARADDDGLDAAGDRGEVAVARVALDLIGVGIDGEHLVAAVAQPLVDDVAAVAARIAGHAGDGDAPVSEELCCGFLDLLHGTPESAPAGAGAHPVLPRIAGLLELRGIIENACGARGRRRNTTAARALRR